MAKTTAKAKKAAPPAAQPEKRTLKPHELVLSPMIQSAVAIEAWSKYAGTVDLAELVDDLRERIKKVQGGDMQPVEAMLVGQAMTLETIFTSLARRASSQEYLKQFQAYLALALKAQAQCRATLEALAEIKNPRQVAFVGQANISQGPQQVNNGPAPAAPAAEMQPAPRELPAPSYGEPLTGPPSTFLRPRETASLQNGLFRAPHGIRLDTRAQSTSGGADPHLAAVEAGHRAAHP